MNPRLTKELRPLLLPWSLAAVAAIGHLLARPDSAYFHGDFGDFIKGLAGVAFVLGALVLAAMPIGAELHERTLALLFSQPIARERIWREKLFATSIMIGALTIIHGTATLAMGRLALDHALLYLAFVVAAISSVGYHTMATRSVLLGIASAAGLPYTITLCAYLLVRYVFGVELELSERASLILILSGSIVYSALSLWLSQRQFVSFELKDGVASRAAEVPAVLVPKALSNLFRCRPSDVTSNLIRKEVRLHKPIFLVSAIFTTAWLLTLLLLVLRPAWHNNGVATLNGLTGTQVVLMVILGGCVALGDDKALGTSAWHLTLPISPRRQWLIKLLTALGTTFAVAVILPGLLAVLTLFKAKAGLLAARPGDLFGLAIPLPVVFVLSFWSASIMPNTVRAALTCVFAMFGIGALAALGIGLSETIFNAFSIQSHPMAWLLAQFQVSPGMFAQHEGTHIYPILLLCLVFLFTALAQSFALFSRGQSRASLRIKYAIILAAIVFFGSFWCSDFNKALPAARKRFDSEVGAALLLLPAAKQSEVDDTWSVSPQELEKTGELPFVTKRWLRDSRITITRIGVAYSRSPAEAFLVSITFPGDHAYAFTYVDYFYSYHN